MPVHVATDLTDTQVQAYRIADNKTGELAEWDFEILPIEISEKNYQALGTTAPLMKKNIVIT